MIDLDNYIPLNELDICMIDHVYGWYNTMHFYKDKVLVTKFTYSNN